MKRLALLLLLAACAQPLRAQWMGSVSIEQGYSDNMFSTAARTPAASQDLSLQFGYFPDESPWAVNYSAAYSTFSQYPDRSYFTHALGGSVGLPYSERNNVSLLASASMRVDREDYNVYDYRQGLASLGVKQYLADALYTQAAYQLRYREYPNFGELSYLEHTFSLATMTFFETRTSIRLSGEFGLKNYSNSFTTTAPINGFAPSTTSGLSIEGGGPGGGGPGGGGPGGGGSGGSGSGSGTGWGNGGTGRGMNERGGMGMDPGVEYIVYDEPTTTQLRASLNIGQGLSDYTGIALRVTQRWNLTDRGRAFVGGAVDMIGEEELFDDPYSYDGTEATFTLTQLLPWSMSAKAGLLYMLKNYPYAADLNNATDSDLRDDTRMGAWLELSSNLLDEWLLFSGLEVTLQYSYLRNQSNTSWYDYSSHNIAVGIGTEF